MSIECPMSNSQQKGECPKSEFCKLANLGPSSQRSLKILERIMSLSEDNASDEVYFDITTDADNSALLTRNSEQVTVVNQLFIGIEPLKVLIMVLSKSAFVHLLLIVLLISLINGELTLALQVLGVIKDVLLF